MCPLAGQLGFRTYVISTHLTLRAKCIRSGPWRDRLEILAYSQTMRFILRAALAQSWSRRRIDGAVGATSIRFGAGVLNRRRTRRTNEIGL